MRKTKSFTTLSAFSGQFHASKNPSLADEPILIGISGLVPDQKITLHSSVHLANSSILECLAHYVADSNGYISLEKQESVGGDYKGVEPMGPFSFMRPSPLNKRKYARFMIKEPKKPFQVHFRVFDNFIPSLEDPSAQNRFQVEPDFTIERTYMVPGVKEIPVWHGNVRGTLYVPPGKGPFPGVISMSGNYPGAMKFKAALLASHGFTAIALKYFGEDDLPNDLTHISIEYIEEAVKFLVNHPSVDGSNGIGIIANCHGGRLASAAASVLPRGLIRCVVSVNGFPFNFFSITYKGKEVAADYKMMEFTTISDDGIRTRIYSFPVNVTRSKSIKIFDHHDISFLFIGGGNDGNVPTPLCSDATRNFFKEAVHPDYEVLHYEGAGHLIEHSFHPLSSIAWTLDGFETYGGYQPYHANAQIDSWSKILNFARKRLCLPEAKL